MPENKAKIAFHIHTIYSDGLYSPKRILEEAKNKGFDFIAITDHNEIAGSLRAIKLSRKYDIQVIPGIELAFLWKNKITELLVYFKDSKKMKSFFQEFLSSNPILPTYNDIDKLTKLISKHDGIFVAPHPLNAKGVLRNKLNINLTSIESVNAENKPQINVRAKKYQQENKLIGVAGCDLHSHLSSLNTFTSAESDKELTSTTILGTLGGENRDVKFSITDGGRKKTFFGPFERLSRTFPHMLFVSRIFVKRVIFKHN